MKQSGLLLLLILISASAFCQLHTDTIAKKPADSAVLRIKNLNPYFTVHVDSMLRYPLEINKDISQYYWFIKNSPVGVKINKDNGLLTTKVDKSFFLSGKLKYDYEYKVALSVQNLNDPADKVDTFFTILFYSTEIIASRIKPTVTNKVFIDEGDTLSFKLQCDNGSFPIEEIRYVSNYAIKSATAVGRCGDDFTWSAPYDFIKSTDKEKQKTIQLYFIGATKFHITDTALIEITVKENINYPQQTLEFQTLFTEVTKYITQLKSSFRIVDKKLKSKKYPYHIRFSICLHCIGRYHFFVSARNQAAGHWQNTAQCWCGFSAC